MSEDADSTLNFDGSTHETAGAQSAGPSSLLGGILARIDSLMRSGVLADIESLMRSDMPHETKVSLLTALEQIVNGSFVPPAKNDAARVSPRVDSNSSPPEVQDPRVERFEKLLASNPRGIELLLDLSERFPNIDHLTQTYILHVLEGVNNQKVIADDAGQPITESTRRLERNLENARKRLQDHMKFLDGLTEHLLTVQREILVLNLIAERQQDLPEGERLFTTESLVAQRDALHELECVIESAARLRGAGTNRPDEARNSRPPGRFDRPSRRRTT